jgi:hypothetical protein
VVKDAVRGWLGHPPGYIRAVGTTGELAVMATPQAQQIIDAMHSIQWRNEVAPLDADGADLVAGTHESVSVGRPSA